MIGDPEFYLNVCYETGTSEPIQAASHSQQQGSGPSNVFQRLYFWHELKQQFNFTVHSAVEATSISWPDCTHLLFLQIFLGTMFQMDAIAAQVKISMAIHPIVKLYSRVRCLTDTVTMANYSV